jgi:site-specific DNA recombinase
MVDQPTQDQRAGHALAAASLNGDGPAHPRSLFGGRTGPRHDTETPDTTFVAWLGRTSKDDVQDPTISLPRQLGNCRSALPPGWVIVAFFWDVESGRKQLEQRGSGSHDLFDIPIARDGGLPELLAEAARKHRRFDTVICESIDRVARVTYYSTKIEHELERLGVRLYAADEGIQLNGRKSTTLLVRRNKQTIAEWYVNQMLELSWDGFCVHTDQGWNVGSPPYGYIGEKIPHPVPARRDAGKTKTKLVPDPDRAPVVAQIFSWRVGERLSYGAIRDRLNGDLDRYTPPTSPDPGRQRTTWSASAVRDVLTNPKYTGYMVWNRRASRTGNGKVNAPKDWVWSSQPTHEPLVTLDMFKAARALVPERERSRTAAGPNRHPQTKRSYLLRSYVFCALCERRMFGKSRKGYSYMACQPSVNHGPEAATRFPGHPASIWIREDYLTGPAFEFFAERIFGPERREHLAAQLAASKSRTSKQSGQRVETLHRAIADIEIRKQRLITTLERGDDPDGVLYREVRERLAQLAHDHETKLAQLAVVEAQLAVAEPCPDVLDQLPSDPIDLAAAPEVALRALFDACRLEIRYDRTTNVATYRAVIGADSLPAIRSALRSLAGPTGPDAAAQGPNSQPQRRGRQHGADAPRFPSAWRPRQDSNLRRTV